MSIAWIMWLLNTWITSLLKCVGLDASTSPPVEEADHLTLSIQCVRGIASQVAAGRGTLLAGRQCRDLSSKLLKTIGNIQELVFKFEASSSVAFRPALESFCRVTDKSRLLVDACSNVDWWRASVFQIQNEEAFREILLEVGLCYNVIYEQAKGRSLLEGLDFDDVEDLRHGSTFLPAPESEVVEDQQSLQRRLEDLAMNSGSSNDQILARYLLGRIEDAGTGMYDASFLQVTEKELQGTWDVANRLIGKGSGAMGICRTKWLGIPCAKKIFVHQEADVTFREEAALLASLSHPNIVKFFCCGNDSTEGERQCFIGMELMETSLHELIKGRGKLGPFPVHVALDIILQIARGMMYLHDLGIAHRDLKPQNVVVDDAHNNTFRVKLVDFGMSKTKVQVSKSNTVSKKGCGTTKYRAPEVFPDAAQYGKQKVKWFKADIYSFAVTCWTILSLKEPFADVDNSKLYRKLVSGTRPELPSHCPRELFELLEECWATSWNARPKFADVCARLEKYKLVHLKRPIIDGREGNMQQEERFDLSTSYTYIETMLTARSKLRTPVGHIATSSSCDDDFATIPSDDDAAANASDADEVEPAVENPMLDLEWISYQKKTFIVTTVSGEDDAMNVAIKKACEEFCKTIDLTRIPSTSERGQAMIDVVDHLQAAFPKYNVLVVYPKHLQHFEECAQCSIALKISEWVIGTVQVYVFKRGDFTLLGDAGFINWCFKGNHERKTNKVTFWDITEKELERELGSDDQASN